MDQFQFNNSKKDKNITDEKLKEIIKFKNSNLEMIKNIKTDEQIYKHLMSNRNFDNLKEVSKSISEKVKLLEESISERDNYINISKSLENKLLKIQNSNIQIHPEQLQETKEIIAKKQNELNQISDQINQVNQKKKEIHKLITEKESNIHNFNLQLEDYNSQHSKIQKDINSKSNEIKKHKDILSQSDKTLAHLKGVNAGLREEEAKSQNRKIMLSDQLETIIDKMKELADTPKMTFKLSEAIEGKKMKESLLRNLNLDKQFNLKTQEEQDEIAAGLKSSIEEQVKIIDSEDYRRKLQEAEKARLEAEFESTEQEKNNVINKISELNTKLQNNEYEMKNQGNKQYQDAQRAKYSSNEDDAMSKEISIKKRETDTILSNIDKLEKEKAILLRDLQKITEPSVEINDLYRDINLLRSEERRLTNELLSKQESSNMIETERILRDIKIQKDKILHIGNSIASLKKDLEKLNKRMNELIQ